MKRSFLRRLLPEAGRARTKNAFVEQFQKIAAHAVSATVELTAGLRRAPGESLARITEIEHQADDCVREVHRLIDRTFIAPYDKRDIVMLTHRLDKIVDTMRTVARLLVSYRALDADKGESLVASATDMCDLTLRSVSTLKDVIDAMPLFDHDGLRDAVRVIDALEDESDELFARAIGTIIPDPNQPLTGAMLAWRDIFQQLERTTDYCGHAMGVIISIARQEGS